jgi:hypothetical protein
MTHPSKAHVAAIAFAASIASLCALPQATWAKSVATRPAQARTMVVRSGDGGWWQIARAHGTTVPHLLAANHATLATHVKVGDHLRLPAEPRSDAKANRPAAAHRVVAPRH